MVMDQKRVKIVPWTYGPGHRKKDTVENPSDPEVLNNAEYIDQEGIRKDINKHWVKYELYTAGHIPWVVHTGKYNPLAGFSSRAGNIENGALIHFVEHTYLD